MKIKIGKFIGIEKHAGKVTKYIFLNLETRHFLKRAALCIGELQNRVLFNIQTRAYQTLCRKDSQQKKSSLLKDECEERDQFFSMLLQFDDFFSSFRTLSNQISV